MKYLVWFLIAFLTSCSIGTPDREDESMSMRGGELGYAGSDGGAIQGKKAWSASGTLTQQDDSNQVSLQANFSEAGPYTVQFGWEIPITSDYFAAEATIEWTVEGNTITRVVSVGDGVSISGNAQSVRVVIRDASSWAGPPTSADYQVSCTIVAGMRPFNTVPPILARQSAADFTVGASTFSSVTVPANVGIKTVFIGVVDPAGTVVPISSVIAKQKAGAQVFMTTDCLLNEWIVLYPGANEIEVTNANAFAVDVVILYGIDG